MSIGDTLTEARGQAGLTITQVSQRTRIRESIIKAIERDDFSTCGGDFYARGHIRSIAGVVGADPVPLITEYDDEHGPPGKMRAAEIFESATPIRIREPRRPRFGWMLVVVLAALLGFGVYRLSSTGTGHAAAAPPPKTHPAATATAKPRATGTTPATHVSGPPEAVIRLTATQDCWVALTSTSGQQLYQGIITAGNSMTWHEKNPVSMVIGNPPGIVLTVNGKTERLNTGQVARLSINPLSKTPVVIG